jgi:hypothetical protein
VKSEVKNREAEDESCDMQKYEIFGGKLHEFKPGVASGKKVIVQVGNVLFDLHYWGEMKDASELAKLLRDDKYSVRLLKEEE